jgi:heme-degrading monooxygenase HmoA
MHARAVSLLVLPGKMDEVIRIYNESIIPAASQLKGFKGVTLLTDVHTGRAMSISMWEEEGDMMAGEQGPFYKEQIGKLLPFSEGQPVERHYAVSLVAKP